jgi:phenylpropionate dioxygenase-like ring-hydroxylating dioxygenase large terminal subunit
MAIPVGERSWIADTETVSELRQDLEQGRTLPAAWYTDPVLYARERDRIFRRMWQYVGLTEQLASPGDFFTATVGDVPVLVVKGKDGDIRAFANVCRHRGAIVVREESGHRTSLQCHYHAWTYRLDGTLLSAPSMKDEPGFDTTCYALPAFGCETWGPFIFVNPDPTGKAPSLAHYMGELPDLVAATGLDLGALRRRMRRTYDIAANWKVVLDNYLECYHCPVAHPGFCDLIDTSAYVITEYEHFSTQQGALKASAGQGKGSPYQVKEGVRDGFYAYLWPNFTINIYPGPGNVSLNLFLPIGPERTLAIYDYCFADVVSNDDEQAFVRFIDQVQEEDIVLCESVQRGLRSGYFEQGHLMLSRERALRHFQQLVYRYVATAQSLVR